MEPNLLVMTRVFTVSIGWVTTAANMEDAEPSAASSHSPGTPKADFNT